MRWLPIVASTQAWLALACCFPSPEQQAAQLEKQAAREASRDARGDSVAINRDHLGAIAAKAGAMGAVPARACDPARLEKLRAGPPEGVDKMFWNMAWLAEVGWLEQAAEAGPSKIEPSGLHFEDHVSLEVKLAFRKASENESYARRDLEGWGETMTRKPALLALIHERRAQDPVLTFAGVGPVDGSFDSGAYVADLSLWDIAAEELLCATHVEAVSSASVDFGGFGATTKEEKLQEDFEEQVGAALNAAASSLSPGLRVLL